MLEYHKLLQSQNNIKIYLIGILFFALNSNTVEIKNIMIAYGTETTYQVYGSETPTPINPSPITSPTEWDMVSCGKQLFNRNYIIEQYKAVNVSYAGFETYDGYDAFYLVNGFMEGSNNLDFLSNYLYKTSTQYTISFKYKKGGYERFNIKGLLYGWNNYSFFN